MARIRTIKPEFWQDERMARVSRDARLLFIGLLNIADDEGRLRGSPLFIRAQIFPYDAEIDVDAKLKELADIERIQRYSFNGESYIWVCKFSDHQKIDKRAESRLPAPPSRQIPPSNWGEPAGNRGEPALNRRAPPISPAGREGNVGEQVMEQGAGSTQELPPPKQTAEPSAIPLSAYRTSTPAEAFFAWAQHQRHAHGLPTEKVPKAEKLRDWFIEAMTRLNGDEELLKQTYARFTEDAHWKSARPPWPFPAFIAQWRENVPEAGNKTAAG